jgi:hypothetical protein
MSGLDFTTVPPRVELYLRELFWQRVHPLLLCFDPDWRLRDIHGDAAHYGIDVDDPAHGVQGLRDLFIGLPLDEPQDVPFVELGNGRSAHLHLIPDENMFHVLLLDADVERDRRRAQQQLGHEEVLASQAKSKAIGQLKQIRSELERQHARLEEANALKNALIATLSHEFRTPLTSIFGYLHLAERRAGDEPTMRSALHAVRRNATYLFTLAENLLEYGRSETTQPLLNPTPVDLEALARDLDAMFRPLAEEKGLAFHVTLKLDDAAEPVFDEIRLRQILLNLLSNAVRYARRRSAPTSPTPASASPRRIARACSRRSIAAATRAARARGSASASSSAWSSRCTARSAWTPKSAPEARSASCCRRRGSAPPRAAAMRSRRGSGCRGAAYWSPTTMRTSPTCSTHCSAISAFACASSPTHRARSSKRWQGGRTCC